MAMAGVGQEEVVSVPLLFFSGFDMLVNMPSSIVCLKVRCKRLIAFAYKLIVFF